MVGVVGTARVKVFDGFSLDTLNINQENFKVALLASSEQTRFCEIKFFITIPYNLDCKNINDYNSFVHPALQQQINASVIATQVINIMKLGSQPVKHITQL